MIIPQGQYEFLCQAILSLFRDKLDLPIDEDHDNHLYENVVPLTHSSDSDSDFTPPLSATIENTPRQPWGNVSDKVSAGKVEDHSKTGMLLLFFCRY